MRIKISSSIDKIGDNLYSFIDRNATTNGIFREGAIFTDLSAMVGSGISIRNNELVVDDIINNPPVYVVKKVIKIDDRGREYILKYPKKFDYLKRYIVNINNAIIIRINNFLMIN